MNRVFGELLCSSMAAAVLSWLRRIAAHSRPSLGTCGVVVPRAVDAKGQVRRFALRLDARWRSLRSYLSAGQVHNQKLARLAEVPPVCVRTRMATFSSPLPMIVVLV